jgi:hypothetical protein
MAGGGTVTFACDGTITLANTLTNELDTVFDATGRSVTISGSNAVRVFYIPSNVALVVQHLTIAGGRSRTGAGVFNDHGTLLCTNSVFQGNQAVGASAPFATPGEDGRGGALANAGLATLVNCVFVGNTALGGAGGSAGSGAMGPAGGAAVGGAVWNLGTLTLLSCTMASNSVTGGLGGTGGSGSLFPPYTPGFPGGPGGDGLGGAVFNSGVARLVNCTVAYNTGAGGMGGAGGMAYGTPDYPPPSPGPPGAPGSGLGGFFDASGQCGLTNCTVAFNSGGGLQASGATLLNTLLEDNLPGSNCIGAIVDLGHNLSSDTSRPFTNRTSLNNTYALLGPLADNGGPTPTIALLPGGWGIDMADTAAAPSTDQRGIPRPFGSAADIGAYEFNSGSNSGPSKVVTECSEPSLLSALSGGGTVTFACDGTIALSRTIAVSTNLTLDAAGHSIRLSGQGTVRPLLVNPGATLTLDGLSIANGRADTGGALLNQGGSVAAVNTTFEANLASVSGGAIRNAGGEVRLLACVFANNQANAANAGRPPGSSASGGAVDNSGAFIADLCLFASNSAVGCSGTATGWYGSDGGAGGSGLGGAIFTQGTMKVSRSTFIGNSAAGAAGGNAREGRHVDFGGTGGRGGRGGDGGRGAGGAIYNAGQTELTDSTFSNNSGIGSVGGRGGDGGGSYGGGIGGGGLGGEGGGGGLGGDAAGAVWNVLSLHLVNSTIASNSTAAGTGGAGGAGGYGGRGGPGGTGGGGGAALGALNDQSGALMTNCTLAQSRGNPGSGGTGGAGGGSGAGQVGANGAPGMAGAGTGGIRAAATRLVNTLLSDNLPSGNAAGTITDLGHNLSSDNSCGFTQAGSLNNTPALLGPLANNGGPTWTMALLPGSPAIDAADPSSAPATDQRGFARPAFAHPDIGAFEYGAAQSPSLQIFRLGGSSISLVGLGDSGRTCRLLTSTNFVDWAPVTTNQIGSNGTVLFGNSGSVPGPWRYYRLVFP